MFVLFGIGAFVGQEIVALFGEAKEIFAGDLEVMGLDDGGVDFIGDEFEANLFFKGAVVVGQEGALAGEGFDDALGFEFVVGFGDGIAVDAEFFGEGTDGGEGFAGAKGAGSGGGLDLVHDLEVNRFAGFKIELEVQGAVAVVIA